MYVYIKLIYSHSCTYTHHKHINLHIIKMRLICLTRGFRNQIFRMFFNFFLFSFGLNEGQWLIRVHMFQVYKCMRVESSERRNCHKLAQNWIKYYMQTFGLQFNAIFPSKQWQPHTHRQWRQSEPFFFFSFRYVVDLLECLNCQELRAWQYGNFTAY